MDQPFRPGEPTDGNHAGNDRPEITVVSPMFNEEACVAEFAARVTGALDRYGRPYEVILVSDGSTDRTEKIARGLCDANPRIRLVVLARNSGQWAAIDAGVRHARGAYVVVMDSDLQHDPDEIPRLVDEIRKGYALVSGARQRRRESWLSRRLPSLLANALLRKISGCPVRDMGGYQCLRVETARRLNLRPGQHRFIPALVYMMGGDVAEVPVSAPPRFAGRTHYSLLRALDVILDILMLWFQRSFRSRPLYLFGRIALALFGAAGGLMAWLLYDKFIHLEPMGTRPPFFASLVLAVTAMAFLFAGFFMEIYSQVTYGQDPAGRYAVRGVYERGADGPPGD